MKSFVKTPRGLTLRISEGEAFGLMARLYPRVKAFQILKATEGYESIYPMLAWMVGIIGFSLQWNVFIIFLATMVTKIPALMITYGGWYKFTLLRDMATLYSYVSGFGFFWVMLIWLATQTVLLPGLISYTLARLLTWIISIMIETKIAKKHYQRYGRTQYSSEIHFKLAYQSFAYALKEKTTTELLDYETKASFWWLCFQDYLEKINAE